MLNRIITAKTHVVNMRWVTMNLIIAAMKNYLMRLYNWFVNVIRKISLEKMEILSAPRKYTMDKESKVVLFI